MGLNIVRDLWENGISAELAVDATSLEELLSKYRDDNHSWIVIAKPDSKERGFKVRSLIRKEELDLRSSELVAFLRHELRTRNGREGAGDISKLPKLLGSNDVGTASERANDVHILVSQHRNKKSNRRNIIESGECTLVFFVSLSCWILLLIRGIAILKSREVAERAVDGPIVAVDARDDLLDGIRNTRLSDPDSWRSLIQNAPLTERKYLGQVHELISDIANERVAHNDEQKHYANAFIYNYRTGSCIYYDLGGTTDR